MSGSGLDGQVMMVPEVTHGTGVTPTRGYESASAEFSVVPGIVKSGGMAAGKFVGRAGRRRRSTQHGEGTLAQDVMPRGLGMLLRQVMGSTATPTVVGTSDAYLQTHTLASFGQLSATIQLGVPLAVDPTTVKPYTYLGCRATSMTITQEGGEEPPPLTVETSWHCRDMTEATGLAAFVDPNDTDQEQPFAFGDWQILIGDLGAEAAVTGVSSFNTKVERPQKTDRYYANSAGRRAYPLSNANVMLTGTITADYTTKADFADRFAADEPFSMINRWVGREIDDDTNETFLFEIHYPVVYLNTGTPNLSGGLEVVSTPFEFEAFDNTDDAPITILYQSLDVTL